MSLFYLRASDLCSAEYETIVTRTSDRSERYVLRDWRPDSRLIFLAERLEAPLLVHVPPILQRPRRDGD